MKCQASLVPTDLAQVFTRECMQRELCRSARKQCATARVGVGEALSCSVCVKALPSEGVSEGTRVIALAMQRAGPKQV